MKISRLVIIDGNAPWVRSLFLAMPAEVDVRFLRVGNPVVFRKLSDHSWWSARRWRRAGPHASQRWVLIPGWGTAPRFSAWLVSKAMRSAVRRRNDDGRPADPSTTAVVFTLPQYAAVAESAAAPLRAYDAHDTFIFYDWDRQKTLELENRMLNACEVSFAVAHAVRADLAARTNRPVHYSPMAVSSDFVEKLRGTAPPCPVELATLLRPIIGCTGQINETYDWKMLGELTQLMPEASFVFIGPIIADAPEQRAVIDAVLKNGPNVHWLGPKPHADLPAYLRAFDVCLNPLAPGPHADRRSPLRLFDYLATDKPVVSTAIAEAASHENHVWIGKDACELAILIREGFSRSRPVDVESRRIYIEQNTWQKRAGQLLATLENCANNIQ